MSQSELETPHQLCELERTLIIQSLPLALLKITYALYLLSGNRSVFYENGGNIFCYYTCTKKTHHYISMQTNDAIKKLQSFSETIGFVDALSGRT